MTITSPIASSIASAIAYPLRGNVGNALVLRAFGAGSSGAIQGLVLGAGPMSVVRGTEATVTDFEGLAKMTLANELRFEYGRRVENLFTDATTTLASGSATTAVNVGIGTFVFSMGAGSGTATFSGTATGSTGTLNADGSSRTAKTLTITAAGTIIVTASAADLATLQLEAVTGQSNQSPSEYVSVGVGTGSENVNNGDFEDSDITDWGVSGATAVRDAEAYAGNFGLKIISTGAGNADRARYSIDGLVIGKTYVCQFWAKRGTGVKQTYRSWSWCTGFITTGQINAGDWQLYTLVAVATATSGLCRFYAADSGSSGDELYIDNFTIKEADHGAFVDGVKYFDYENGNTVSSNTVTEAKGSDLTTEWYALFEPSEINYADGDNDLSGGAETVDLTAGGAGDFTLSVYGTAAVTVAAGTATGTGFAQATEGSDVTFNLSVAGTVTLTLDSGALDTTNGLAQKQIEKSAFFTSWIPTSGSQETRWADDAMPFVSVSGNVDETKGMAVFDLIPSVSSADLPATQAVISLSDATNSLFRLESSSPQIKSFDGTNTASAILAFAAGNRYRFAVRWSANDSEFQVGYRDITGAGSWVWGSAQTFDGAFVTGTNINIFYPVPSAPFVIRDLRIYETDEGIGWIEANY